MVVNCDQPQALKKTQKYHGMIPWRGKTFNWIIFKSWVITIESLHPKTCSQLMGCKTLNANNKMQPRHNIDMIMWCTCGWTLQTKATKLLPCMWVKGCRILYSVNRLFLWLFLWLYRGSRSISPLPMSIIQRCDLWLMPLVQTTSSFVYMQKEADGTEQCLFCLCPCGR